MELREPIEEINRRLLETYGSQYGDAPRFRVVWSEDQLEKRITEYTDQGFHLLHPEVRELPKYKQWVRAKYILEHIIPVPEGETDLIAKVSYEPLWAFMDKKGNYLPPFYDGCVHIIDSMLANMGRKDTFVKYKDPNVTPEARLAELKRVEDELFGNETNMTDDLHSGAGITVPENTVIH
jgi:hypothetical protein